MNARLLILAVLLMLTPLLPASAATIKVPSAKCPTLQAGIDAAQSGDTVLVGDGTYRGNGNRDLNFHGKSLTVKSAHGPAKAIIDCQGSASKPHRGFYVHQDELAVTIDGFTVEHGFTTNEAVPQIVTGWGPKLGGGGGGIYINSQGSAVVTNCVCRDDAANSDYGGGGGVYLNSSGVVVANCAFRGNTIRGGITRSDAFTGRENGDGTINGNYGGGAYTYSGSAAGGGLYIYSSGDGRGGVEVRNCTFHSNRASSATRGGQGGGAYIRTYNRLATITNCAFRGDTASGNYGGGGGAYMSVGGGLTVTNCLFSGNTARGKIGGQGGGAQLYSGGAGGVNLTVMNCTFSGNAAGNATQGDTPRGGSGAAAYIYVGSGATVINSIAWGNKITGSSALATEFYAPFPDPAPSVPHPVLFLYNDSEGGTSGMGNIASGKGNINKYPQFVNAAAGDFHLQPGSPCLGAGTHEGAPATDLDGKPRSNPPSMGVYELAN